MKYIALIGGKEMPVEVEKKDGVFSLTLGDKSLSVDAIRLNHHLFSLLVEGKSHEVAVERQGNSYSIHFYDDMVELALYDARRYKAAELTRRPGGPAGPTKISAPMPGKIVRVSVAENSQVSEGQPLLIIEAMKMQNEIKAPRAGTVKRLSVRDGESVSSQQVLLVLE